MKQKIITKAFSQVLVGIVISIIYMQFRPHESYTLSWPFSFLAVWFLLWGWIAYLKYDRLSVFDVTERYKKQIENEQRFHESSFFNQKTPNFMNYIYTPILKDDPTSTKTEVLKIRMAANFICCVVFIVLTIIF